MIGQTLNNRYKITDRLGKGAMGTVYRATDTQTDQEVAIKIISTELELDPEMLERFKREGGALRQLRHANIVGFIEAFQHKDTYVIVMEYVSGGSLHDLLKKGPLPIEHARKIALGICDALVHSHQLNIIHRDIKPENILISEGGTPKLADFGVARLIEGTRMTRTGTKVGTPYYMAPEAWKGESVDSQADIWSLGVILFEMLAGTVPFDGDSEFTVMTKVCTTSPPNLKKLRADVPPQLVKVVSHMLTREKKRRYQSIRQVGVDLENSRQAPTPKPAISERTGAFNSFKPRYLLMGGILIVAAISIFIVFSSPVGLLSTETPVITPSVSTDATEARSQATQAPSETIEVQTICGPTESRPSATGVAAEISFDYPPGGALECAVRGDYSGTTVTVDGAFEGSDPDGVKFADSMKAFEEATGITVNYIGNNDFAGSIAARVSAGDAPDIADFSEPDLFASFVRSGDIVPATDFLSEEWLSQQYNAGWRELMTVDSVEAGIMHRYFGKSLVWYPKQAFETAGYQVPETWDGLLALTQQIADDGDTAWCIGIESGAATGWVATDWTEDLMLRTTSLENYDAWVAGTLPFDSPEVRTAIETWSNVWFNDAFVRGGRSSIVSTFFGDAPAGMFSDPPECWLHRQANFITIFFPEGKVYGTDYDFFYLPPVDDAHGRPFLIAGDFIVMMNDRPEVRALMEYFTTPQSVSGWLQGGGVLSPHQTATQDMYSTVLDYDISQLVAQATSFRFDGSDLMPSEVGDGPFWEHISSYVAGSEDLDTAMQAIDASWPR